MCAYLITTKNPDVVAQDVCVSAVMLGQAVKEQGHFFPHHAKPVLRVSIILLRRPNESRDCIRT